MQNEQGDSNIYYVKPDENVINKEKSRFNLDPRGFQNIKRKRKVGMA
jgi:hypothetical protein